MPSSVASSTVQVITIIVFGIIATVVSGLTVWQGHKVWKLWKEHHRECAKKYETGQRNP